MWALLLQAYAQRKAHPEFAQVGIYIKSAPAAWLAQTQGETAVTALEVTSETAERQFSFVHSY